MDDRSESKHASKTKAKEKLYTSRDPLRFSSDSSSDDVVNVVKTQSKDDVCSTEQPGSKPSFLRRLVNLINGGDGNNMKFAGANLKRPDIHGPTEQQSGDKPSDGPTQTCSHDRLEEVAQPTIEHNYKEEHFDNSNMSNRDDAKNDEGSNGGMSRKDTNIRGPTEQQTGDKPSDGPTQTCSHDRLDEAAQPTIEHIYTEEYFGSSSMLNLDNTTHNEEGNEGISKNDTNIKENENHSKYRYTCEELLKENQELKEDRPGKPSVKEILTDSVEIAWEGLNSFRTGDVYQVHIRNVHTGMQGMKLFEINSGKIGGLEPGSEYIFKVRLVKSEGDSKYSENSEIVKTKEKTKVDPPGQPRVGNITTDSVDISWDDMPDFCIDDVYQVHIKNVQKGDERTVKFKTNEGKITGLQPSTQFVFKVRLVMANAEESEYSEVVTAHTTDSYALMLLREAKFVKEYTNGLSVYQLPMEELQEARNKEAKTKKFHLGPREENDIRQKTIMLVGATGTGKSTFVDCLANYILGVRQEYKFRFTVIQDEDRVRQHNQAESQTDWISCYSFNPQPGNLLNYRINIIDTPGFGDMRGLLRDNETVDQIRQLVEETGQKGVKNLDAVCFLVKAPDSRLTVIQMYIFQAIMSLFGRNMKDNICTIITFADGSGPPPVLSALKASKLPFGVPFIYNNSALTSHPKEDLSVLFWKMNLHSYENMFSHFEELETKSIHLTKEVLQERRRLDITCQNLQIKLDAGLSAVESLYKEIKIYQDNEEKIKNNENFTYVVTEKKEVEVTIPDGLSDTYCLKCNETCHRSCLITYESFKGWCWAMNWLTGNCGECSGKCHWRRHINRSFRTEIVYEEVTKTYEEMQKTFQDASGCRLTLEQMLSTMDAKVDHEANSIETMLTDMWKCKNRLAEIALRSSPYEMTDLIDLLISTEMYERGQGYKHRIEALNKILSLAELNENVDRFQEKKWRVKQALGATLNKS